MTIMELENGIQLLQKEREKQIEKGYDIHNDLKYMHEQLIDASICYLGQGSSDCIYIDEIYPWQEETFKPSENPDRVEARKEDIVKAGAMIVAHLNVIQHLIDTKNQLSDKYFDLAGKTVYFKLAGKMYFGVVASTSLSAETGNMSTINNIKNIDDFEDDWHFAALELANDEIWTFV